MIIKRCGGPRRVADWLRIDRSTVQRWIGEGRVPAKRWAPLIIAAKLNGVEIAIDELIPQAAREAERLSMEKPKRRKAAA
jgi:predicted site-specific integrase-resolvase